MDVNAVRDYAVAGGTVKEAVLGLLEKPDARRRIW